VGDQGLGRGVLYQDVAASRLSLARYPPSAELEPFVDFHWIVRWDLRGQPPHEQKILPHPNVNLAFEESGSAVYGVDRKLFVRRLDGRGRALGVRLRPGGFPTHSGTLRSRGSPIGRSRRRRCSAPRLLRPRKRS
jgi:hypothetical protein